MKKGINECYTNPCKQNSTCEDLSNGYKCHCIPGTSGKNCEIGEDECLNNPCIHGRCEDQLNDYECVCESGYFGKNCESQVPPCPTENSNYIIVENKCYYLQQTSLNYQNAINVCREKFKHMGKGILFEPKTLDEFKKVYDAAETKLQLGSYSAWIGIRKSSNGVLVYTSTGRPITFQPPWYSGHSLTRNDGFCISVFQEKFLDNYFPNDKRPFICVNN